MLRPCGAKALMAENISLRQQLIVIEHTRTRAPTLTIWQHLSFAAFTFLILPKRLYKTAIVITLATLLKSHKALIKRKYSMLFTNKTKEKPGLKGPSTELIKLIIEMKKRRP